MLKTLALPAALLLAGCATSPTAVATNVTLVKDVNLIVRCQNLGQIHTSSLMGGILQSQGYDNALTDLKNQAASRGATHILLMNISSGYAGSNMLGDAYRCGRPV